MTKFEDKLWDHVVEQRGEDLARADHVAVSRRPRFTRGRLAGAAGTLVAGIAAVTTVLSTAGSAPAFAVVPQPNGSVLIKIDMSDDIVDANAKLHDMGTQEAITIWMEGGPARVAGAVTCSRDPLSHPNGPAVEVLVGKDGTETYQGAQYHLDHCIVYAG